MCTGFINRGDDIVFGFNLDIDPAVWNYKLVKNNDIFSVKITVGKTSYFTHGVNRQGCFSNLPYMNDYNGSSNKAVIKKERIDLLTDRYLRGKYSYSDVLNIVENKAVVNIPNGSMHSLIANKSGDAIIVEPGYGYKTVLDRYAVLTNFPVLTQVNKFEPYFGKERYDKAVDFLEANPNITAEEGLDLLKSVTQDGQWATRISFTYSANENCVYYVTDRNFGDVHTHYFTENRHIGLD